MASDSFPRNSELDTYFPDSALLTIILTSPVRLRTRRVWKKKRRFLWLGRVVEKKLQRATQQKLEMDKEKRESSHSSEAILLVTNCPSTRSGRDG